MLNTVSITDLKQNTAEIIQRVKDGETIIILQRSKPVAVLVDLETYKTLEEARKKLRKSQ